MRTHRLILALVAGLGLFLAGGPLVVAAAKADAKSIGKLVTQLVGANTAASEEAAKTLEAIGPDALEALRKAADNPDEAVQRRAADLIQKIEKAAAIKKIMTPTAVRLAFQNKFVPEAVAELAKQSGYAVTLGGDKTKIAKKRITLVTGDTTFWDALDQLCKEAGLVEGTLSDLQNQDQNPNANQNQNFQPQVRIINGRRVLVNPNVVAPVLPAFNLAAPNDANQIVLVEGKYQSLPTYYHESMRIRALPTDTPLLVQTRGAGEIALVLEIRPEPKCQWGALKGIKPERIVDDNGQSMGQMRISGAPPNVLNGIPLVGGPQQFSLRFQELEKPSKAMKELKGILKAEVQAPCPVMTIDNILKSANKTVKSSKGGFITVREVARLQNGQLRLRLQMEDPPDANPLGAALGAGLPNIQPGQVGGVQVGGVQVGGFPAGGVQVGGVIGGGQIINGVPIGGFPVGGVQVGGVPVIGGGQLIGGFPGGNVLAPNLGASGGFSKLALIDANGKTIPLANVLPHVNNNGMLSQDVVLVYQLQKNQPDPARLVYNGHQTLALEIPFELKNIPLP